MINDKIISPASGKVIFVKEKSNYTHIAIFLNIYDNHTQYAPVDGIINDMIYFPGNFYPAFLNIGMKNEQLVTIINSAIGPFVIKQIAGTLFKRIVSYVNKGNVIRQRQQIGEIKMGSRVDLYMPKIIKPLIKKDDKVIAGESIIGTI